MAYIHEKLHFWGNNFAPVCLFGPVRLLNLTKFPTSTLIWSSTFIRNLRVYTWVKKKKQVWFCFEACSLKQQDLNFTRWNVSGRFIFKLKTKGYCLHQRRFDKFLHLISILRVLCLHIDFDPLSTRGWLLIDNFKISINRY